MDELVNAGEIAGILGTSRREVANLADGSRDFPDAVEGPAGGRRYWDRHAIERWAAAQGEPRWGWRRPALSGPGYFTPLTRRVLDIAGREARDLHHDFIGDVHILLALLDPGCAGAAREALESFGFGQADVRQAVIESVGRPEEPARGGQLLDRSTNSLLEQAKLQAIELRDEDVSSEHVLLALACRGRSPACRILTERGVRLGELAERVFALTEIPGTRLGPDAAPLAEHEIHAAEVARVLGVSRARVVDLATEPGFPGSELSSPGIRCWPRMEILRWAAAHPHRGPSPRLFAPAEDGELRPRLDEILRIASAEAEALNHGWIGPDHLLLALLHPACPGAAREALESFGASLDDLRAAWVESMGDPFEPTGRAAVIPPRTHHMLERAALTAVEFEDDEIASEHVLLALTDDWPGSPVAKLIAERGGDAAPVRQRLIAISDGMLPAPRPPAPRELPTSPKRVARPPLPALAPSPLGHDPRRRKPWGSGVFCTTDGETFTQGHALRQYRIDRDGYPVLTRDGKPIHSLIDEEGRDVVDERGDHIDVAVDIPPNAQMQAYPKTER